MEEWYYDHFPETVYVSRIYCFKWDDFSEENWKELSQIYEVLPGWRGKYRLPPSWFGLEEWGNENFIQAGVEPPGLMIHGRLLKDDWIRWDEEFRKWAQSLPTYAPR